MKLLGKIVSVIERGRYLIVILWVLSLSVRATEPIIKSTDIVASFQTTFACKIVCQFDMNIGTII